MKKNLIQHKYIIHIVRKLLSPNWLGILYTLDKQNSFGLILHLCLQNNENWESPTKNQLSPLKPTSTTPDALMHLGPAKLQEYRELKNKLKKKESAKVHTELGKAMPRNVMVDSSGCVTVDVRGGDEQSGVEVSLEPTEEESRQEAVNIVIQKEQELAKCR